MVLLDYTPAFLLYLLLASDWLEENFILLSQ